MARFENEHWDWEQVGAREVAVTCKENGALVYAFDGDDDSDAAYSEQDIYDNASLIAAAPDMYRLLKSILKTKQCSVQAVKSLLNEIEPF